jgi:hypothetical protein
MLLKYDEVIHLVQSNYLVIGIRIVESYYKIYELI